MTPYKEHFDLVPRTNWKPGAWMKEPDKAEFLSHNLPCIIMRDEEGYLHGYVGVGGGHILHGRGLDAPNVFPCFGCNDTHYGCTPRGAVLVYGGLRYAGPSQPNAVLGRGLNTSIVPDHGLWWLGFCADLNRDYRPSCGALPWKEIESYKGMNWMRSKCEGLALDLIKIDRFVNGMKEAA